MIGQQIGNYLFISILGEGGMATVYLAENTLLGKKVAIKLLKQEFVNNTNIRGRFLAEARHMVQVSHTHIISVLDLIDAGDIVAIVMEYVDGQSLKEYLQKKGRLNDSEIRTLFTQILTALQHVHDSGFVHRDIKPSNFMLTREGSIKLADFGIAKDLNKRFELTETGTQMGTPIYMSPEQVRDSKDVDCRSDIYSLGVVLYEAITGSFPFDKNNLSLPEIQICILREALPKTGMMWDDQITKATAKNERDRFQSCEEWLEVFVKKEQLNSFEKPIEKTSHSNTQTSSDSSNSSESTYETSQKKYLFIGIGVVILIGILTFIWWPEKDSVTRPIATSLENGKEIKVENGSSNINKNIVKDRDENYPSIKIGSLTWTKENLNVSTFRNGDKIPEAKTKEDWIKAGEEEKPAWCYYENNLKNGVKYGKLYNWYAVNDPRGLSPKGWHISRKNEWREIERKLGEGSQWIAGWKIRSQNMWIYANGTNESGFSALPGGSRDELAKFDNEFDESGELGYFGSWWNSDYVSENEAFCISLNGGAMDGGWISFETGNKKSGLSVRCVKD